MDTEKEDNKAGSKKYPARQKKGKELLGSIS